MLTCTGDQGMTHERVPSPSQCRGSKVSTKSQRATSRRDSTQKTSGSCLESWRSLQKVLQWQRCHALASILGKFLVQRAPGQVLPKFHCMLLDSPHVTAKCISQDVQLDYACIDTKFLLCQQTKKTMLIELIWSCSENYKDLVFAVSSSVYTYIIMFS